MNEEKIEYEVGSGNIFKDLGLPEPGGETHESPLGLHH